MEALTTGRNRLLAVVALIGMIAVACGSNDAKPPADVLQVLDLRIDGEPQTLDPALAAFANDTSLAKLLFSGLFTYDEDLQIVANLAAEVPTGDNGGISADGLTYTVTLRDNLTWSDGTPLTAADFVYSLKRALDPRLAAPFAGFYGSIAGAPEYIGALGNPEKPNEVSDEQFAALADALGVEATGDTTLVYTLSSPNPSFLNILALPTAFPVKQSVVEQVGPAWTEAGSLVGNGPFVLQDWQHDQGLTLGANQFWHEETPLLTAVNIQIIGDDTAAYAAYQAGELDVVSVPVPSRQEVAAPSSPLHDQLVREPQLFTFAMMMNAAFAPFDNQMVRQAFATAIDRDAYVAAVLQGSGHATTSWLPPAIPGYDESVGSQYKFDAAKAQQLLAEAGYPNGEGLPEIVFTAVAVPSMQTAGEFVEAQLEANLNIDVTFDYVDPPVFGQRFVQNQHQAALVGWGADWPYPDSFLPELLSSAGTNNHVGYANAEFDRLVAEAASEIDDDRRIELYEQAHKLAIDEAALAPIYNREVFLLVKPEVRNLIVTAADGGIFGDLFLHQTFVTNN
jgi:oligopeptide transport system substrate-binding protein